jgi:spore germination protein GerM
VFPVKRAGARTLSEAITELLKGPGTEELNAGYFTSLSPGIEVLHAEIRENGVAAIDLSEHAVAGIVPESCRATAIRAQIVKTAQGFPDVKSVALTVGGKADHALE